MYLPYAVYLSVSSLPEASGKLRPAATGPTRNHLLVVLKTASANCGARRFPPVGTGESVVVITRRVASQVRRPRRAPQQRALPRQMAQPRLAQLPQDSSPRERRRPV